MAVQPRRLARPSTGGLVVLGVVLALVLIVVAAYHGSNAGSAAPCGAARPVLRRTLADVETARTSVASTGGAAPGLIGQLQRDSDDINSGLNGAQAPDSTFTDQVLPVADGLGRVVTDLRDHTAETVHDIGTLDGAARAAAQFCGAA